MYLFITVCILSCGIGYYAYEYTKKEYTLANPIKEGVLTSLIFFWILLLLSFFPSAIVMALGPHKVASIETYPLARINDQYVFVSNGYYYVTSIVNGIPDTQKVKTVFNSKGEAPYIQKISHISDSHWCYVFWTAEIEYTVFVPENIVIPLIVEKN